MGVSAWTWYDVSPTDACTLVEYLAAVGNPHELARLASTNPVAQSRTARRLLADGRARKVIGAAAQRALSDPGHLLWREDHSRAWTPI